MRFKDKIVLITGSAGGIGFKTALDFGNEGAIVAVTDIDFEMAKKLSNQIISNGGVAEPFQLDVTNLEQTKNVFETLNEGIKVRKPSVEKTLGSASKATNTPTTKKPIVESNEAYLRMQKLAGLIK